VNVTCQDCRSVFRVDPAKVPPNGVRARCSICGAIIRISVGAMTPLTNAAIARSLTPMQSPVVSASSESSAPEVRRPTPATTESNLPYPARPTPSFSSMGIGASTSTPESVPLAPAHATSDSTMDGLAPLEFITEPEPPPPPQAADVVPAGLPAVTFGLDPIAPVPVSGYFQPDRMPAPIDVSLTGASVAPSMPTSPVMEPLSPAVTARPLVPLPPPTPGQLVGLPEPTPVAAPLASGQVAESRRVINPFLRSDPITRAKRLARALVSDMVAYQPAKRADGLANGTLKQLFRDEIRKSYDEYVEQVGREVAESTAFFQDALNEVLADGRRVF